MKEQSEAAKQKWEEFIENMAFQSHPLSGNDVISVDSKLWCSLLTFNKPLTPSFFTVDKKDVIAPPTKQE